ncbi:DUF4838 domain-containing protein [Paenibacillus sp. J5C2022]|uniref:DUF4838 domain-containing protein n=1 Tax=Paenibacillus sp. J5C2022 TaxID=2977129 RepID=UPI0021D00852|nr:DUF4838 domain-containing protein [Paenibacillus sp. J5C2022]
MNRRIDIAVVDSAMKQEPTRFAVSELERYVHAMTGMPVSVRSFEQYDHLIPAIWVGEYSQFSLLASSSGFFSPYDDEITVKMTGCEGIIAGLHPRSVLQAVYRYLTEAGCRWVRPGDDGAFIPSKPLFHTNVDLQETPSYRHRGVCIEGAVSIDHVTAMIDWLPKVGMNSYFIQFREAYVFFARWYRHAHNPLVPEEEDFDLAKAEEYVARIVRELAKRGMIYHAVGHGWTCEPFGIRGISWDEKWEGDVPEEALSSMAMIGGERKLFGGIPLNTNLCYSNPSVRTKMVAEIAEYAGRHPEIDLLHVWLSDGSNNQCECEACAMTTPSDCYVKLLNELDAALTAKAYPTKIVFLLYIDLLWPPEHERIQCTDRFMLLFAPYTRSYRQSFGMEEKIPPLPAYQRNKLELPPTVAGNLAFLQAWQRLFEGEGIDFDYPFMWAHYLDPGLMRISRIVSEDIKHLRHIGLNGYMSCQVQRSFFPHGLGITVMARTLWNADTNVRAEAEDYFHSAFGDDGLLALEYMEAWSDLFDRINLEQAGEANLELLKEVPVLIQRFSEVLRRNLSNDKDSLQNVHIVSWNYIALHAEIWSSIVSAMRAFIEEESERADLYWEAVKLNIWEKEPDYVRVFDAFHFIRTCDNMMQTLREKGSLRSL